MKTKLTFAVLLVIQMLLAQADPASDPAATAGELSSIACPPGKPPLTLDQLIKELIVRGVTRPTLTDEEVEILRRSPCALVRQNVDRTIAAWKDSYMESPFYQVEPRQYRPGGRVRVTWRAPKADVSIYGTKQADQGQLDVAGGKPIWASRVEVPISVRSPREITDKKLEAVMMPIPARSGHVLNRSLMDFLMDLRGRHQDHLPSSRLREMVQLHYLGFQMTDLDRAKFAFDPELRRLMESKSSDADNSVLEERHNPLTSPDLVLAAQFGMESKDLGDLLGGKYCFAGKEADVSALRQELGGFTLAEEAEELAQMAGSRRCPPTPPAIIFKGPYTCDPAKDCVNWLSRHKGYGDLRSTTKQSGEIVGSCEIDISIDGQVSIILAGPHVHFENTSGADPEKQDFRTNRCTQPYWGVVKLEEPRVISRECTNGEILRRPRDVEKRLVSKDVNKTIFSFHDKARGPGCFTLAFNWSIDPKLVPPLRMGGEAQKYAEKLVAGETYVRIAGGTLTFGCWEKDRGECQDDEKPGVNVKLSPYWLSKYEVSNGAYRAWAASRGISTIGLGTNDKLPVTRVTWKEASDYCAAAGGSLPTETQWEFGARAGMLSADQTDWNNVVFKEGGDPGLQPVDARQANGLGLYNMMGNAMEWVLDTYSPTFIKVLQADMYDPANRSDGTEKVTRGGAHDREKRHIRFSARDHNPQTARHPNLGFRCALRD